YQMGYAHQRPTVDAGDNQIITGPAPYSTNLTGWVDHDILPPGDTITFQWTQIEGPTSADITPSDSLNPIISNLTTGVYTFRLTADDNAYYPFDDVNVWVQATTEDKQLLYLRFEADLDGNPARLEVANEMAFGHNFEQLPLQSVLDDPELQDANYVAILDPNIPVNPIPLTTAANNFSLGPPLDTMRIEGTVETYPELTFPEEITVEFFSEIGNEDDLAVIDFLSDLNDSGFRIYNPGALKVQYYIDGDAPGRFECIELTTNINLSDYTTGSGIDTEYHPVGWKHVAWTYEKTTGISRIFENGVPAYITHVNGVSRPGELLFDGIDGRGLIMPGLLDSQNNPTLLTIAAGVDIEPGSLLDEIRITAVPLLPEKFLIVADNYCTEYLLADFNGDCIVNLLDYIILANQWLKNTNPYIN
ncbi:MAG: hypothetical protein GY869_25805, partial [Planctomycetes bacterium]|nr:hypothetical protein [Planctomycetota bacterium]